ncbi:MAG: CopG family transcriptional regulator [Nocardioidaceae bacterium]
MKRTNLYLDEHQTAALDEVARAAGISRAELVRRLVDQGMAGGPADLEADLDAIEASFGALDDAPQPARGTDARAAHLSRVRRL